MQAALIINFTDLKNGDILSSGDMVELLNHEGCSRSFEYRVQKVDYNIIENEVISCEGIFTVPEVNDQDTEFEVISVRNSGAGFSPCCSLQLVMYAKAELDVSNLTGATAVLSKESGIGEYDNVIVTIMPEIGKEFVNAPEVSVTGATAGEVTSGTGGDQGKYFCNIRTFQTHAKITVTGTTQGVEYDITVENDGNGIASANVTKAVIGDVITLAATPNDGYQFKEWQVISGEAVINDNAFAMPASGVTIKAFFEEIVPEHIHDFSELYSSDSDNHWRECNCGEKADIGIHSLSDWIIDKVATTIETGSKHKECTICGKSLLLETIPKIEDGNEEETGDEEGAGKISSDSSIIGNAPDTNLLSTTSQLKDKVLTADEVARVGAGEDARIYLEVKEFDNTVSSGDAELVENNLGDNILGMFLDISLFKKIGDDDVQKVTNTNGAISVSVKIPDSLLNTDSGKNRTYQIARVHNGAVNFLGGNYDSSTGYFTFETDAFSTYAIVYKDEIKSDQTSDPEPTPSQPEATGEVKDRVPKTGDGVGVGLWILLAAIGGTGVAYFARKKNKLSLKI